MIRFNWIGWVGMMLAIDVLACSNVEYATQEVFLATETPYVITEPPYDPTDDPQGPVVPPTPQDDQAQGLEVLINGTLVTVEDDLPYAAMVHIELGQDFGGTPLAAEDFDVSVGDLATQRVTWQVDVPPGPYILTLDFTSEQGESLLLYVTSIVIQ